MTAMTQRPGSFEGYDFAVRIKYIYIYIYTHTYVFIYDQTDSDNSGSLDKKEVELLIRGDAV